MRALAHRGRLFLGAAVLAGVARAALGALGPPSIPPAESSARRSDAALEPRPAVLEPLSAAPAAPTPPLAPAGAAELERQACTRCHLVGGGRFLFASYDAFQRGPVPGGAECARCHLNNVLAATAPRPAAWLPLGREVLGRIRRFHAYAANPAIAPAVDVLLPGGELRRVSRFTRCGLDRFLAAPVPRRAGAPQSMVPVEEGRRRALLAALGPELAPCGAGTPAPAAVDRGRRLFASHACGACHAGAGPGPRLRLGIPLLARDYVRARVRLGSGGGAPAPIWQRGWEVDGESIVSSTRAAAVMPPHPGLTDGDLDALAAYIETDRSDVPPSLPATPDPIVAVADDIRVPLYREVQRRVFDTSCRHCHTDEPEAAAIVRTTFGSTDPADAAPLLLPFSRLPTPTGDGALRAVLDPGPGCSDSRLLARLRARAAEWRGQRPAGAPRGMPLTMPPLPAETIHLVAVWTRDGCPSDAGDLCARCTAEPGADRIRR